VGFVAGAHRRRRALGEAARRRIEERFSLRAVAARYEALYETLAQRGAGQQASARVQVRRP
jgi:glycosyltransferase involved in cell wall biosynthesis